MKWLVNSSNSGEISRGSGNISLNNSFVLDSKSFAEVFQIHCNSLKTLFHRSVSTAHHNVSAAFSVVK